MILGQGVLQLFCSQCPLWLKWLSLKRGLIQTNIHRILRKYNQVICIMCPNSMPDIMILAQGFLQLFCWQDCQSQKRKIIQPNIYRILPKVKQVIYTLDTISEPHIMVLAKVVLQIFCWWGSIGLQSLRRKRGIFQSNIHRILWKVDQVICITCANNLTNIFILAQAVLQIFCWQDCFTIQNGKVGKGR